jgi:hypoxanthine phosphoribosyltransferase
MKNVTSMNDLISIQEIKQEASATFLSSEIDKYIASHKTELDIFYGTDLLKKTECAYRHLLFNIDLSYGVCPKIIVPTNEIDKLVYYISCEIEETLIKLNSKSPLVVTILSGGLIFSNALLKTFKFPYSKDYISCTFYPHETYIGDEFSYKRIPDIEQYDSIILIDDILDTGRTMRDIINYLKADLEFSKTIYPVTLLKREKSPSLNNHIYGKLIKDEWVAGYGMNDKNGYSRLIDFIFEEK